MSFLLTPSLRYQKSPVLGRGSRGETALGKDGDCSGTGTFYSPTFTPSCVSPGGTVEEGRGGREGTESPRREWGRFTVVPPGTRT